MDKKEINIAVGAKVRGLIAEHRDNQESLAKYLGLSATGFRKKVSGKTGFTVAELALIANKYQKVMDYFFLQLMLS